MSAARISEPMLATPEDIYNLIKEEDKSLNSKVVFIHPKKTGNRAMNMSLGRVWFNLILPEDYDLINEPVNKARMNAIIIDLYKKYGVEKAAEAISHIQSEAFKLATIEPNTFNIRVFTPPREWLKLKADFEKVADKLDPVEFKKEAEKVTKELIKYITDSGFKLENILESGAKGNPIADWNSLMVSKGYVIDIEGNLLGPIVNSINDGYGKIDYYNAAAEARRNFFFRSSLTANPGYLTTKVVMANAGLSIDKSEKDCGTKTCFEIVVTPEISNLIQYRYYSESGKLKRVEGEDIIGKTIKLRSPLYCKSEKGICPTCYGDLWKILNTENIGILAGGAVNVVGVNALMKMRHKASSVSTKEVDFPEMIKKSGVDIKSLEGFFKINKNIIEAKEPCTVVIDQREYDDTILIDCGDKYQIPGIITVQFGEGEEITNVTLPVPIVVDLLKPNEYNTDGYLITLKYEPGETILKQDFYNDDYDERVVMRLFEAGAKYITNPEILVNFMRDRLPGIDLVHLETIVSNMFRDADDDSKPARLTNYKNFVIIGQKRLPFITSWLNALAFENINKAIKTGLLEGKDAKLDPIEKIVSEKFRQE